MVQPKRSLPLQDDTLTEEYICELLNFVGDSDLLQALIGGVHILDFFTRAPSLYSSLLPVSWRAWFDSHDVQTIIDFLLRDDLATQHLQGRPPPDDLLQFVSQVRRLSLLRDFVPLKPAEGVVVSNDSGTIPRHVAVGMKTKKIHEVDNFARYVDTLVAGIAMRTDKPISHLVDFGSGQNYLGRTLASPPYSRQVIAVEGRPHNINGAKAKDIHAKLAPKSAVHVNKKQYRTEQLLLHERHLAPSSDTTHKLFLSDKDAEFRRMTQVEDTVKARLHDSSDGGTIQYVEHKIEDGNLAAVVDEIADNPMVQSPPQHETVESSIVKSPNQEATSRRLLMKKPSRLLVMSLHSCGNLSHHALRSVQNESVAAVAIIGCCYNLITERTIPTYKLPSLRPTSDCSADYCEKGDSQGFPMSERVVRHRTPIRREISFNICARMMAVQAPQNWGPAADEAFFTRHFFRALLQKIFLDKGVVSVTDDARHGFDQGGYVLGGAAGASTQPVIIGSLSKSCYTDFVSYVRGATKKLRKDPNRGDFYASKLDPLSDEEIRGYAKEYDSGRKDLSTVWSLMAFSATLVEAVIVVDRYSYLKEQSCIAECWVEPVFSYSQSPRNLAVVGIKR